MVFLLWKSAYDFRDGIQQSRIREEVRALLAGSEYLRLYFRMEPFADLLDDQGRIAASAAVDDHYKNPEPILIKPRPYIIKGVRYLFSLCASLS